MYNDGIPAFLQPQTPQHLPESRHRSRYHPSYTAPGDGRLGHPRVIQGPPSTRYLGRSGNAGMNTPGVEGLFGGQENSDDEVMFDRASRRLWDLEVARRRSRSTNDTADEDVSSADGHV